MKPRHLNPRDIRAHGDYPSNYGGEHTVFEWASMFHLGAQFHADLREGIRDAGRFCAFGADNNPLVLASVFNETLDRSGRLS